MIASGGIAALVRAFVFALVDQATGATVMELGPQSSPLDGFALSMAHGRDDITDSQLYWSNTPEPPGPPTSPSAYTELVGPNASGHDAPPRLTLRDESSTTGAAELTGPRPAGGAEAQVLAMYDTTTSLPEARLSATDGGTEVTSVRVLPAGVRLITRPAYMVVADEIASGTASPALTTVITDLAGATITVTGLRAGDRAQIIGIFDMACSAAPGIVVAVGYLNITGSGNQAQQAIFQAAAAGHRATVSQTWKFTVPTDGDYTFKLRAAKTGAGGVYTCFSTHTRIALTILATR